MFKKVHKYGEFTELVEIYKAKYTHVTVEKLII